MPASSSSLSVLAPVIGVGASPPVPLSAMESIRLVHALKTAPDPRRRRGRRHGLQSVLPLAVQAVMGGAGSWGSGSAAHEAAGDGQDGCDQVTASGAVARGRKPRIGLVTEGVVHRLTSLRVRP